MVAKCSKETDVLRTAPRLKMIAFKRHGHPKKKVPKNEEQKKNLFFSDKFL